MFNINDRRYDPLSTSINDPFQDHPSPLNRINLPVRRAGVRSKSVLNHLPNEAEYSTLADSEVSFDSEYTDHRRPTSITVIGVLLIISFVFDLVQVMALLPNAGNLTGWVWPVLVVDCGLLLASIVGLFKMKKYGANAFLCQAILSTVFGFAAGGGLTALVNLVVSLIMLMFVFRKYEDME